MVFSPMTHFCGTAIPCVPYCSNPNLLGEKWCDTRNHLTGYQPKKDQVGGQSDEAVARILVQLHYPT